MATEVDEAEARKHCHKETTSLPDEVRAKYFPTNTIPFSYDVLPLFGLQEYEKKVMKEVSILENPSYARRWKEFMERMPVSVIDLKPARSDVSKVAIFANYRRQKVPVEFLTAFVAPSSPEALFHKK